jgi:sec-independent protein translocase protein TatC
MSFLEHIDELRRRLVYSIVVVILAFFVCWFVSDKIYNFLSVPIVRALSEAERRELPMSGRTGDEKVLALSSLKEGDEGRYVFDKATKLGMSIVQPGTSVRAVVGRDQGGSLGVFTAEPVITSNSVIPVGVRLPVDLSAALSEPDVGERLIVTTAGEAFTLYVTVSMYAAIALAVPFLLWQIWAFISPGLYKHERAYVTPFIGLSSISFIAGVAFAYYVLLPPSIRYLIGLAEDFKPLLRASDYFDFVTIVLLGMGLIFQMPAITYVLARIGLVSAHFLVKSWKVSLIIILIAAALISPTGDIPNMMLFASPMVALYVASIFIAWFFGRKRKTDAEV